MNGLRALSGPETKPASREIAVDWWLTTQPNSDELGDTQMKSRSPEVLTPQHSDNLGATQHNSATGAIRTLNLRVVGSIPTRLTIDSKGLSDSTTRRFTEITICGLWIRLSPGSPLIRPNILKRHGIEPASGAVRLGDHPAAIYRQAAWPNQ